MQTSEASTTSKARRTFLRFALVGVLNTALGLSLFPLLNWSMNLCVHVTLWMNDILLTVSYAACTLSAFLLHKRVTFASQGKTHVEGIKFMIVNAANLAINILVFNAILHYINARPIPTQMGIAVALQLGNYFILRRYVFWQKATHVKEEY